MILSFDVILRWPERELRLTLYAEKLENVSVKSLRNAMNSQYPIISALNTKKNLNFFKLLYKKTVNMSKSESGDEMVVSKLIWKNSECKFDLENPQPQLTKRNWRWSKLSAALADNFVYRQFYWIIHIVSANI